MEVRGDPSDADVVARVLSGDREAFGLLIRRYEAGLLRFATRMLGNRDVATDAVAESFIRAYRHLASCRYARMKLSATASVATSRFPRDRKSVV